ALRIEEAAAACKTGVTGVADDLDVRGRQDQPDPAAAFAHVVDGTADRVEAAVQRLAPARGEVEADLRSRRVDAGRLRDRGEQRRGQRQQRYADPARGTVPAPVHGHQKAERLAIPGSMAASAGRVSTAIAPGGMPRYSPDWP